MRGAILAAAAALAVVVGPAGARAPAVCAQCVLDHIAYLAAPERQGRRCAMADEASAADYLAGQLRVSGPRGAAPGGGFVQTVPLRGVQYAAPPVLTIGGVALRYGEDFASQAMLASTAGVLALASDGVPAGDAVVLDDRPGPGGGGAVLRAPGVRVLLVQANATLLEHWDELASQLPGRVAADADPAPWPVPPAAIYLKPGAFAAIRKLARGTPVRLAAESVAYVGATHNVLGVIHGSAPDADRRAVLLSAHYDHLGVLAGHLYPGANDDASGTAAVLEFARLLAHGSSPRRTVYFALFGCEEAGGYGAAWFRAHPPTAQLADIVANLEFEMIGFPDPKRRGALMMTGWERSDLGPALAAHGALVGPDLYPEQHLFQRSDNYPLALKGVVAHTVSAWPSPPTYHQPTDSFAALDKTYAARMVASLVGPLRWLVDGDFTPRWNPGGRP